MTEQDRPNPSPPEAPFHPQETPPPASGVDRRVLYGCGAGCLVVALLAGVVLVGLVLRGTSLLRWALLASKDVLAEAAPEAWSEADQRRLDAAYAGAAAALEAGRAEPGELETIQRRLLHCLRRARSGELTEEDLKRLVDALEGVDRADARGGLRQGAALRALALPVAVAV